MKVIAAPGLKVPMEDKPRDYITDAKAIDVPESAYYLRRLADGDLVMPKGAPPPQEESVQSAKSSKDRK
jgi:hypothetical protein